MTAQEHSACSKRRVLTMTYDGVIGLLWRRFLERVTADLATCKHRQKCWKTELM
jgi:hypothetical protein